ncbi:hypothetical protein Hanom_Chr07g00653911 [Helianthus anomalus]
MLKDRYITEWEVLYKSRTIITRNIDRRPGYKIDCTGIIDYVP